MADAHPPVRVSCAFAGPAESLFDAWLDPAVARLWLFATPEGLSIRAEIDPRTGGGFVLAENRGGLKVEHGGRYLLVERPHRLAFELRVPPASEVATIVSVAIMQLGEWLILSLTHEGVPPELTERTEQGWSRSLDRLATLLDAARAAELGEAPGAVA